MAGEAQRRRREAGHRVEGEAHHLAERIVGLAGVALGAIIGKRHLPEADPGNHAADEARLFGQRQQRIERAAAHQAEVAGVQRDRRIGDAIEHAVEGGGGGFLEDRLAVALAAHRIDDVRLLRRHRRAHVGEQFGRVLQIGVDDEDLLARTQVEPRGQRELMAVVARQVDRDDARVGGGQALHHRPAVVAAAIVDQDDLMIVAHRRPCRGRDARVQQLEARGLIVAGNDDGQRGTVHNAPSVTGPAPVIHTYRMDESRHLPSPRARPGVPLLRQRREEAGPRLFGRGDGGSSLRRSRAVRRR